MNAFKYDSPLLSKICGYVESRNALSESDRLVFVTGRCFEYAYELYRRFGTDPSVSVVGRGCLTPTADLASISRSISAIDYNHFLLSVEGGATRVLFDAFGAEDYLVDASDFDAVLWVRDAQDLKRQLPLVSSGWERIRVYHTLTPEELTKKYIHIGIKEKENKI